MTSTEHPHDHRHHPVCTPRFTEPALLSS